MFPSWLSVVFDLSLCERVRPFLRSVLSRTVGTWYPQTVRRLQHGCLAVRGPSASDNLVVRTYVIFKYTSIHMHTYICFVDERGQQNKENKSTCEEHETTINIEWFKSILILKVL